MIGKLLRTLLAFTLVAGIASAGIRINPENYDIQGALNGTLWVGPGGGHGVSNTGEHGETPWYFDDESGTYVIVDGRTQEVIGSVEFFETGNETISGWFTPAGGLPEDTSAGRALTGTRRT